MSSCQGRVRVISSKARRMFTFSPLRPITKSHDGDYDCEVDPGTRSDPGLALCRSPSPRVCVNMCTVCNISSYHRLCSPLPFIHCGQAGPEQTNTRLCLCRIIRAPRVISRSFSDADIILGFIFSRCVCDTGPPPVPQRDFCGRTKS